ncbi:MAG: response regulator transcription factor [Betaproteobacteria bacterium]
MTATPVKTRIFLIDDHPAVRHGLALLLADVDAEICGERGALAGALDAVIEAHADLAIVDLSLGNETAFDLISELSAHKMPVLVYSMHEDSKSIDQSLRAGALAYVSKREESEVLCLAVQALLRGQRYLSPYAEKALAERRTQPASRFAGVQLSEREEEIMAQLANGYGPSDVAQALSISVRTVESYCSRIIDKLNLSGMKELRLVSIQEKK